MTSRKPGRLVFRSPAHQDAPTQRAGQMGGDRPGRIRAHDPGSSPNLGKARPRAPAERRFWRATRSGRGRERYHEHDFYIRIPAPLKDRLETLARKDGVSLNAWTIRCLERCTALPEIGEHLSEIFATTDTLRSKSAPDDLQSDTLRTMIARMDAQAAKIAWLLGWRGDTLEALSSDGRGHPSTSRGPRPRSITPRFHAKPPHRRGFGRHPSIVAGTYGRWRLPATICVPMLPGMFTVSETEAAAIRTAFDQEGELSAALELRRLFPGITDNALARACARAIAGWQPAPVTPTPVTRSRSGKTRQPGKRTLPRG